MGAETEFRFSVRAESEFSGLPRYLYLQARAHSHLFFKYQKTRLGKQFPKTGTCNPSAPALREDTKTGESQRTYRVASLYMQ